LRLSFYVSWWAFSFPSAAFTNAALVYAQFEGGAFNQALAVAMVAFSTLLILWLLIRTIVAVARNEPQLTD
jgi:tellurite resistance protein